MNEKNGNPLEYESIWKLIGRFAVPAVTASLISALYNIVDQIFIGHSIGPLGNAATNVAFPLVLIMAAVAMTFGVGGASKFSLLLGQNEKEQAGKIIGNSITILLVFGICIMVITLTFLRPLMAVFGAREGVLSLAMDYTGITAIGLPFSVISCGGSYLIRADGRPKYAMASSISGAVLNTILDPVFIFGFHWGIKGAALATIIGQAVSGILVLSYFRRFQSVPLRKSSFILDKAVMSDIFSLGFSAGSNQLAISFMQILMNNTLGFYGEQSVYGRDIPLAVVGVVSKVTVIFSAMIMGVAHGCQPVAGYNYGAGNYRRVSRIFTTAAVIVCTISAAAFFCFQMFPRQIVSLFGSGDELYFEFAVKYLRIFLFGTFINGFQMLTANFFPSVGYGKLGAFTALSRQIIFLLPLILVLPMFFGIDGVLWAGPVADGAAGILAVVLIIPQLKKWNGMEAAVNSGMQSSGIVR